MSVDSAHMAQYYLDNCFKFPKEIKNDIIYCQRALKAHIKVHQMVLDVFDQQEDANPVQKQRILDELETEIYEINAEQQFLFLRLRRVIDEFYKVLKRNGIPLDRNATNMIISREVVPLVSDESVEILPMTVPFRYTEEKLIEKYFEVQKEKQVYEVVDSDEESVILIDEKTKVTALSGKYKLEGAGVTEPPSPDAGLPTSSRNTNASHLSQMSLLKPMAQRMVSTSTAPMSILGGADTAQYSQVASADDLPDSTTSPEALRNYGAPPENMSTSNEANIEMPVSKNVKMSRLNLRQALNKARTENMAAKAAASKLARSTTQPAAVNTNTVVSTNSAVAAAAAVTHAVPSKKYDIKTRATRSSALAVTAAAKERANTELNSSSEDSNPERISTPTRSRTGSLEPEEERTQPEHYGQEMFLRIFNLYTPEVLVLMQQRRSKRKRRTVHSNERADFHYGRIEYGSYPPPEKKRKAFLLSPQVKRNLQTVKRPKRGSAEKNEEAAPSRSSSSSPDEKRCCNECLKGGGCFEQCSECKGYYHQSCHREEDEEKSVVKKTTTVVNKQLKLCPACKRTQSKLLKKETQQYQSLQNTAQDLAKKLAQEKDRRAKLQHDSKMFKIQMRNFLNIVNTIKSDQENDSSE